MQCFEITGVGDAAGVGECEPGAGTFALVALDDVHLSGALQGAHVFGQQGIADFEKVAQVAEFDTFGSSECGHDRKTDRSVNRLVEPDAGVGVGCGHRDQRLNQAAAPTRYAVIINAASSTSHRVKWCGRTVWSMISPAIVAMRPASATGLLIVRAS